LLTHWKKLAFAVMSFVGIWLMSEALVGYFYRAEILAWESPPPLSRDRDAKPMQGNPYLIYEYPPGTHAERGVTMKINSLGLRGLEPIIPKPAELRRFITTGDSSVFGFGVEDNEVFSVIAADLLGGCDGCATRTELPSWSPLPAVSGVESICGATPGYSSYQSINLMRLRGLKTEPDLFVIANLWSDNNFDSFVDKEILALYSGYEESLAGQLKRVLAHSSIYRVLDWRLRVKKQQGKLEDHIRQVGWMLEGGQPTGRRRVAINDYAQNLETLTQMALTSNAEVLFVILPNNEDIDEAGELVIAPKAWNPYREVMRETAARHGAQVIEMPQLFVDSGYTKEELFIDEMHPTPRGHALMGAALAELLEEAGWADGGSVMSEGDGSELQTYTDPFVEGEQSGGATDAPIRAGGGPQYTVEGTLSCSSCTGPIRLEAITTDTLHPTVLGWDYINDSQGEFNFGVQSDGALESVVLRAYDLNGGESTDGMTPMTFNAGEIPLAEEGSTVLAVDLDEQSISVQ
jgi:hypothetical protein